VRGRAVPGRPVDTVVVEDVGFLAIVAISVELLAQPTWVKSPGFSGASGVGFSASLSVWTLIFVPAGIGLVPSRSAVVFAVTWKVTWFCPPTFEQVEVNVTCPFLPSVTVWPSEKKRSPWE
jgi:hypothetical protein